MKGMDLYTFSAVFILCHVLGCICWHCYYHKYVLITEPTIYDLERRWESMLNESLSVSNFSQGNVCYNLITSKSYFGGICVPGNGIY